MKRLLLLTLCCLLLVPALTITAQDDENTCTTTATEIITTTLTDCAETGDDQVCTNGADTLPAGISELTDVTSLSSPALDADAGTYGVALLNTSATLPRTLDGPGVVYLLLGDATLENQVDPATAFIPADPVSVVTTVSANLRTRPSTNDSVLDSVLAGAALSADGLSADGAWLRVSVDGNPAWISRGLVEGEGLEALPVINPAARALMQDFTLRTTMSEDCAGVTNALVIQGLDEQPINLRVNRADMRIRGTVVLRAEERTYAEFANDPLWFAEFAALLPDATPADDAVCQFTELAAVDGDAFLNNGLFSIPRGYRAFAFDCNTMGDVLWNRSAPMASDQLRALSVLEDLPADTLRTTVSVPTVGDIARVTAQIASGGNTEDGNPAAAGPTVAGFPTCPGFVPTSPVTSIPFGRVRFYWDPAAGAARYLVNVYNYADELIISVPSEGSRTSARVETMSPRFSLRTDRTPPMSYEVLAFDEAGDVLCATQRLYLLRDFDPDPDCPPSEWFSGTCEDVIINDP